MIYRREFQDKLTKELLKIVHFNSLKFVFERSQGCMYMDSQINWITDRTSSDIGEAEICHRQLNALRWGLKTGPAEKR